MTESVETPPVGPPPEAGADPAPSTWRRLIASMHPRVIWGMADDQPVVLKQFVQFCLIIVYPAYLFFVLCSIAAYGLFYVTVYPVLWLVFLPVRMWMKRNRPEEYAASQRKK
ncbi:hypothetical protein [Mycolicibacterium bacteremicum]|uniref:hypothetical protein n=1 Tax=Mycolicibacterium bacteremicum TaxID=564198 RepID=UPI0026E95268|nr:hypothetical protein [Mycolicibacterium bacteremicum]